MPEEGAWEANDTSQNVEVTLMLTKKEYRLLTCTAQMALLLTMAEPEVMGEIAKRSWQLRDCIHAISECEEAAETLPKKLDNMDKSLGFES